MKKRVVLAWSGGKDSAWALHVLRSDPEVELAGLFTTFREGTDRVAVHDVPARLLRAQAAATGLPLHAIAIPDPCPNQAYEAAVNGALAAMPGVSHVAFGDLFLEDIRRYRETQLAATGLLPVFPLWGRDTRALAGEMIAAGLQAWIVCVDTERGDPGWAGARFDREFVERLPTAVDPCGENGEFHTFVFAGPMLSTAVRCRPGPVVARGRFAYAPLLC